MIMCISINHISTQEMFIDGMGEAKYGNFRFLEGLEFFL